MANRRSNSQGFRPRLPPGGLLCPWVQQNPRGLGFNSKPMEVRPLDPNMGSGLIYDLITPQISPQGGWYWILKNYLFFPETSNVLGYQKLGIYNLFHKTLV